MPEGDNFKIEKVFGYEADDGPKTVVSVSFDDTVDIDLVRFKIALKLQDPDLSDEDRVFWSALLKMKKVVRK